MATREALSAEVWRLMFQLVMSTRPVRDRALAKRGMTPNDARALQSLDVKTGRSMRWLAAQWGCDASNATWIVDRLERLGFAERRAVPEDRRVKHVVLTAAGAKTRSDLIAEFMTPPAELGALSKADLTALKAALGHLHPQD